MMTSCLIAAALLAAADASADVWTNRFGATFADYAPGEALSAKGTRGGTWSVTGEGVPTGFSDGERHGVALVASNAEDSVRFDVSETIARGQSVRVCFSVRADELGLDEVGTPRCAGKPAALASDSEGGSEFLVGWTADGWVRLGADGFQLRKGQWIDGVIELKTVETNRLVSYSVKVGSEFVRLRSDDGEEWFRTVAAAGAREVGAVSYYGACGVSDLAGDEGAAADGRTVRWQGGETGSWDEPANWEGGRVPGADGDIAVLDGTVTLTNGEGSVTAVDLQLAFVEGRAQRLGGTIRSSVSIDVSRPRVGKKLSPDVATLFGLGPSYDYAWTRGSALGGFDARPCATTRDYTPTAADCGHWLRFEAKEGDETVYAKTFFCSRLPVVYIATDDGGSITSKTDYKTASLRIQGNDDFKEQYDGAVEIRGRGNSSWNYPKKPYKLKLDKKTNLFGFGKQKHWVLISNWLDECYMRNWLASDLAAKLGVARMEMTWVDVVLNGTFQGNYMFCEHIRVDSSRIDIFDWSDVIESEGHVETDLSWLDAEPDVDFSGGYLFELSDEYDDVSKFTTARGLKVMVDTPEYAKTSAKMFAAMKGIWSDFETASTAADSFAGDRHLTELADLESMVGYWLVQEALGNNDASYKSRFAYVDRGGKLTFGPVWDFDWGCGSAALGTTPSATGWKLSLGNSGANIYREWLDDPLFCLRACERYWSELRPYLADEILAAGAALDRNFARLAESAAADKTRWASSGFQWTRRWFDGDAVKFAAYLRDRLVWLDEQFASVGTLMASVKVAHSATPYAKDDAKLSLVAVRQGGAQVEVRVDDASVASVRCLANGHDVGLESVVSGGCSFKVPRVALTAAVGCCDLIEVIAKDASGKTVARNYVTLLRERPIGTMLLVR